MSSFLDIRFLDPYDAFDTYFNPQFPSDAVDKPFFHLFTYTDYDTGYLDFLSSPRGFYDVTITSKHTGRFFRVRVFSKGSSSDGYLVFPLKRQSDSRLLMRDDARTILCAMNELLPTKEKRNESLFINSEDALYRSLFYFLDTQCKISFYSLFSIQSVTEEFHPQSQSRYLHADVLFNGERVSFGKSVNALFLDQITPFGKTTFRTFFALLDKKQTRELFYLHVHYDRSALIDRYFLCLCLDYLLAKKEIQLKLLFEPDSYELFKHYPEVSKSHSLIDGSSLERFFR